MRRKSGGMFQTKSIGCTSRYTLPSLEDPLYIHVDYTVSSALVMAIIRKPRRLEY